MTQVAIDSIGCGARVIMVESNPQVSYNNAETLIPDRPFNYNAYLNMRTCASNEEFIFFGNNDLILEPGWEVTLINRMKFYNIEPAYASCTLSHEQFNFKPNSGGYFGYVIYRRLCGWAFMWTQRLFTELRGLDESLSFWCSDNAAVEQLLKTNQKLILVMARIIYHLNQGGNTICLLDKQQIINYTIGGIERYNHPYRRELSVDKSWRLPKGLSVNNFNE